MLFFFFFFLQWQTTITLSQSSFKNKIKNVAVQCLNNVWRGRKKKTQVKYNWHIWKEQTLTKCGLCATRMLAFCFLFFQKILSVIKKSAVLVFLA